MFRYLRKNAVIFQFVAGLYLLGYGVVRIGFEGCCVNSDKTVIFMDGDRSNFAKSILYYFYLPAGRIDELMTGHGYCESWDHPDA